MRPTAPTRRAPSRGAARQRTPSRGAVHHRVRALQVLVATLLLAGCTSGPGGPAASDAPAPGAAPSSAPDAPVHEVSGELTVYAAASLAAAFDEIVAELETAHPGLVVRPVVYDGSSALATQVVEGAPVDVFASADEKNMAKATDEGAVAGAPVLFATNTLVLVVPAGNPGGVTGLADLADPDLRVVLCAVEVPCGSASRALLAEAGLTVVPDSAEQNVAAVLTKVVADEADAGLVYRTDVVGADVESIVPEGAEDVVNRYPVATLADAANPEAAEAFVAFVTGPHGQQVLAAHGFGPP